MPNPKSAKNRAKLRRKLSTGQLVTIVCACIAAAGAIIAAVVPALLPSPSGPTSAGHHNTAAGIAASLPTFNGALTEIRSNNPRVRSRGVADFGIVYSTHDSATQWRIITILVQYIIDHAPSKPSGAATFAYCLSSPAPFYPSDVTDALRIIGERSDANIGRAINLSDVNLAYAVLDGLNFAYVNFDNDLLCRTISYDSSFRGASFQGADLRFATIMNAQGLTARQLRASYSLCKAKLPQVVAASRPIEYLARKDLPLCDVK